MSFLYDEKTPKMLDGTGLQADPDVIARTRARQDAVREKMGMKWICHPVHSVGRSNQSIAEISAKAQAEAQPKNVVRIQRRKP